MIQVPSTIGQFDSDVDEFHAQAIMFTASPSMADSFVGRFYWIIAVLAALAFAYLAHVFKDGP